MLTTTQTYTAHQHRYQHNLCRTRNVCKKKEVLQELCPKLQSLNSVTNFNWPYRKHTCSTVPSLEREQAARSDFISRVSDVPTDVTRSAHDVNLVAIHSTSIATALTVTRFDVCTGTDRQFSDTQILPLLYTPPGLTLRNSTYCPHWIYVFLCGSENKQSLFPHTALTGWFL